MYYNEKTAAKLINALIASVENGRPSFLRHTWIDEKGRQCSCDGFRAYRLNVPVAGVPDIEAEKAIDLGKIVPDVSTMRPLELPSLADVRAMMQEDKRAEKRGEKPLKIYTFGTGEDGDPLPAVNISYLADMLQMFPQARAYYKDAINAILFLDENGDGVLLPLRIQDAEKTKHRRQAPAPVVKDNSPAMGLRTFAAIYAA